MTESSKRTIGMILFVMGMLTTSTSAWSAHRQFSRLIPRHETILRYSNDSKDLEEPSKDCATDVHETRRRFLTAAAMNICWLGAGAQASLAAEAPLPPGTKYISGKTPIAPGETKKKSDNVKGTRKDPDFLRSVADCKNQCQSSVGPDGLAKSKEDCLSECQDICCKTYEQCTFNIVPRL